MHVFEGPGRSGSDGAQPAVFQPAAGYPPLLRYPAQLGANTISRF
jgi:hypothetical protein